MDVKKLSDYYPMFSYVKPYSNLSTKATFRSFGSTDSELILTQRGE